jgi:hypothetical protein
MLPLTLFLAKLIGLLFLVFSLLMAMNNAHAFCQP